jgi:excisionase family DNA binding protein
VSKHAGEGEAADAGLGRGYYRVSEAATYLSLSRATLYHLMDANQLAYVKFGQSRRIPIEALKAYEKKCLVSAV